MLFPSFAKTEFAEEEQSLSELEKYFINPPASARPWCFWQWMNGNITKQGITLDLEAMKRMGIGGVINFNNATGIPRGPVDYASNEWMEMVEHAAAEAERLDITYTMHNSAGYSGCGGPWITPEMSMQQLVWTETLINSNGRVDIQLPKPYAKHQYYRDAFVVAWPSLPAEQVLMKDKLSRVLLDGKEIDKQIITDRNPETKIRLEVKEGGKISNDANAYAISPGTSGSNTTGGTYKNSSLVLEFIEPFEARAITIYRKPEIPRDLFDGPRDHPTPFRLEYSDDNITYKLIGIIRPPELREMDTPAALSFNAVKAKFFRLSVTASNWLSEVELHNSPRLSGWPGKTNNTHGDSNGETPIEQENIIQLSSIVDITNKMDTNGHLKWDAPQGRWTILRIGHTTTGEETFAHPDSAHGLQTDKFRTDALELHFEKFLNNVIDKLRKYKSFKGFTVDSWEAGKQNWSIDFPKQFEQKNKYDITQWMPALTGRIVESPEGTENFLWDVRRTQADLLSKNFYGHYKELLDKKGLEFYAEPYGDGNFDSLQIGQHLDITMSEFWTRYIYGSDNYSKQAASAAHIYGKKIVAAEAFTAMPATSRWTDYPYSLKAEGDYFFTLGVNRLVFHVFVHQPYTTGKPGMTMGPFGMHIDRNNTWTEQAYGWTNYLCRTQYLLQQGLTVADICYFKGDNPETGVPDIYKFLPAGYTGDVIGADALQKRMSVKDGKIVLPDGMQYRLCVMAPLQQILPATFNRIKELVHNGMVLVVSNKPSKAYGKAADTEVQAIANEMYGALDGKNTTERNYGKGKIIWNNNLEKVVQKLSIRPDFYYTAENPDATIHYIHKKIGSDEFYFVANHKRRKENIVCSFRIQDRQPEIWNSETGKLYDAVLFETKDGRIQLSLELEPAGSLCIVFRKKIVTDGFTGILKDGISLVTTQLIGKAKPGLYADVKNNFTISIWAKPDTFAHPNKSMLFHAPEGEVLYGVDHVAIALSAGQNVVRIYERGTGQAKEILAFNGPLEGWTHIAVVYENGKPSLYINGKQVAQKEASGKIVHPELGAAPSVEQFASYFEGNYTSPQLLNKVLNEQQIKNLYDEGLSPLVLPTGIHLTKQKDQIKALIWQNGNYTLQSNRQTKQIGNIAGCNANDITGEWKVKFPKDSGAPSEIVLPSLISLHKHENFNVKHFSGTCTYSKTITVSKNDLLPDKKLFLHLGRVEVIAEVKINGARAGLLWKEPFLIDITKTVTPGDNLLEVAVTNLWPNRLIGDEYLPIENEYSEHKFIQKMPEWFVNNQPKPGERKSFAVWKTHDRHDPLLESGWLGPVKLITAIERSIFF